MTPFYAYTGNHPRWCLLEIPVISPNPSAEQHLRRIQKIQVELSSHLQKALAQHKANADRHRLNSSSRELEIVYGYYEAM